jgi:soluble lytic murein transglycosylase-like protein
MSSGWLRVLGACVVLALGACAARNNGDTLPSRADEPAHDAANEWRGDEPPPVKRVALPAAPLDPPPPPRELRELTREEIDRYRRVQRFVHAAAREHDLPPDLINGIIWVESKFEPKARGHKGPRGLMQVMPRTGRWIATKIGRKYLPHNAEFNIHAGTYYFAAMVKRYNGNLTLALVAYHRGPADVDQWARDGTPLPDVSRRYVENVFTAARAFRSRDYDSRDYEPAPSIRSRPEVSSRSKKPSSLPSWAMKWVSAWNSSARGLGSSFVPSCFSTAPHGNISSKLSSCAA